jgi:hypothetical protein
MAGTGKSTISRTVARNFAAQNRLVASFFFKRGEGDRSKATKFFTTIASQIFQAQSKAAVAIKEAIDIEPNILRKGIQQQFQKLIFEPLSAILHSSKQPGLIIIIDALDECENSDDTMLIIHLLSQFKVLVSPCIRIFLTSRPDLPIRLGFNKIQGAHQHLVLHEIPDSVIAHDIKAYLESEVARIRDSYNNSVPGDRELQADWPGQFVIDNLVQMSTPLFIFASTVCRFLSDRRCGNPDMQLKQVMMYQTKSQETKLDATYLPILNQFLHGLSIAEKEKVLKEFRSLVGSIVVLASPLSTSSLAQMLSVPRESIDHKLDFLHSVLSIPSSPDKPVRQLHLSFRDFLVDPEKQDPRKREANPFWVDEKQTHADLAKNCLRLMAERLHSNICDVGWPGTPRYAIGSQIIKTRLQPELEYACLYWIYHVEQAGATLEDGDQVDDFLLHHFLHWLEALSYLGKISESISLIKTLQALIKVRFEYGT